MALSLAVLSFALSVLSTRWGRLCAAQAQWSLKSWERTESVLQGNSDSFTECTAQKETENRHSELLSGTFFWQQQTVWVSLQLSARWTDAVRHKRDNFTASDEAENISAETPASSVCPTVKRRDCLNCCCSRVFNPELVLDPVSAPFCCLSVLSGNKTSANEQIVSAVLWNHNTVQLIFSSR